MAGANLSVGINNSEFNSGMKSMTTQLKSLKSEFNLASTQAKLFGDRTDQLKVQQQELTKKVELQSQQVQLLKDRTVGIANEILNHKKKQSDLASQIADTNQRYKESCDQTGKASDESKELKAQLEKLKEEYARTEDAIESKGKQLENTRIKLDNNKASLLENKKALEDVTKVIDGAKFDKIADSLEKTGGKITSVGKGMSILSGGIVAIGTAGVATFKSVDEGIDNLITATGASGEALDSLKRSFNNVASSSTADFAVVGAAVGEVNTRFGFTEDALESCTQQFLKFSEINKIDTVQAVQLVSRAMGDAGIEASEYGTMLDALTVAAQASGIGIDTLTELCTKYGAPMRALGFDTQESIAIFAQWELAGVNTEIAFSGMKTAIGNWGKEGKDAREEFKKTLKEIEACPDIATATTKAIEIFGQKAGPDLADAIKGGRFAYEDFLGLIEGSVGTVNKTFEETQDATDQAKIAMNAAQLALSDLGNEILVGANPIIEGLTTAIQQASEWFRNLDSDQKQNVIQIGLLVAAIGPGLIVIGNLTTGVAGAVRGFKDMYLGVGGAITKIQEFSPVVLDNINHLYTLTKSALAPALTKVQEFSVVVLDNAAHLGSLAKSVITSTLEFGKQAVQTGITTAQMIASKAATLASTVATNGMALAQGALNVVLAANPIALVVIALVGLGAAFVTLWNKCEWFRDGVTGLWESIKGIFTKGIDAIKSFMNFEWSLPKIKMPHFNISGSFSLNPPSIPKFSVDWYHTGAIFKQRTVLPGGIGVGDRFKGTGNNAEAIIPLDSLYREVAKIIGEEFDKRELKLGGVQLSVVIQNFINNREQDIESLAEELAFYLKRHAF